MPLETVATVIGLLAVCSKTISGLKELYEGSACAPNLDSAVRNEIHEFTFILSKLQSIILESDSIFYSTCSVPPLDFDQLLAGCVGTFNELNEQVDGLRSIQKRDFLNRMKWSRMEKSLSQLTQRLQNHKASLTLILTILTTESTSEIMRYNRRFERHLSTSTESQTQWIDFELPRDPPAVSQAVYNSGVGVSNQDESVDSAALNPNPAVGDGTYSCLSDLHAGRNPDSRIDGTNKATSNDSVIVNSDSTSSERSDSVINPSAASLPSSQCEKSRWSVLTGGSDASIFSLPLFLQPTSQTSPAEDITPPLSATVTAISTSSSKLYNLNVVSTPTPAKAGKTPDAICVAAGNGEVEEIVRLLTQGANLEGTDTKERTALSIAASHGHVVIVRLLLERGANKEARCESGRTPLHYAAWDGHEETVQLLLDREAEKEARDKLGQTPLHEAAHQGHETTVRLLLDQGARKEARCKSGLTPLHYAAWDGHETTVKYLLDRGAGKEARDKWGDTPLHYAAMDGHKTTAQLLLDRGVKKEVADKVFRVPLHYAASGGHEAIVQLLLERGVDKNPRDRWNRTPLHLAVNRGHEGVLQLLLDRGADPHTKDIFGVSPATDARIPRRKSMSRRLSGWQARWISNGGDKDTVQVAVEESVHT